jgi:hypothetical protein
MLARARYDARACGETATENEEARSRRMLKSGKLRSPRAGGDCSCATEYIARSGEGGGPGCGWCGVRLDTRCACLKRGPCVSRAGIGQESKKKKGI